MTTVPAGETSATIVDHYNDEKEENDDYYDDETSEDEEAELEFAHFQKQQRQQQQQPEIDDENDDFDEDDSESESEAWEDVSDDIVDDDESEIESDEEEIVLEEGEEDDVEENNDRIKNDKMLQRVRIRMLTDENSTDDDDISEEAVSDDDEVEIVSEEDDSDEYEEYDDEVDNGISKNEEMLQRVRNMMLSGENNNDDHDDISDSQYSNEVRNSPELVISNTSDHISNSSSSSSIRRRNNVSKDVWEAFDADDDNAFGSENDDDDYYDDDVNREEKEPKWEESFNDDGDDDAWNPMKKGDSSNANRESKLAADVVDSKIVDDEVQVERWLDRDADEPDDYIYAIRRLSQTIYGENDPDNDVETMLRRSTPKDLYKYLKQQYWYRVHTKQLEEDALTKNKPNIEVEDNNHQMSQQERNSKHKTEAIEEFLLSRHTNSSHHQSLESTRMKSEVKGEEGDEEEFYLETNDSDEESFIEEMEETSTHGQNKAELLPETSEKGDESESSMYESLLARQENSEYVSALHESDLSREESIVDDPSDSNYDVLREERFALYTGEYNETLARQESGKNVDEDRLYLLELAVRDRLGEELTQDELLDLEDFDAGENQEQTIVEVESLSTEERSIPDDNRSSSVQGFLNNDTASSAASDEYKGDNSMSMGGFADFNSDRDITDATSAAGASINEFSQEDISVSIGDLNCLNNASAANDGSEVSDDNSQGDSSLSMGDVTGLKNGNTKFVANDVSEVNDNSQGNNSLSFGNDINFSTGKEESNFLVERESSLHSSLFNGDSNFSFSQLQDVRADLPMVNSERPLKISVKDPKELEWRKKKIEEDLYSMIEDAEKEELKELVDTETIAALTSGAMNVALTKKYKDSSKGEYIYYPSVAKAAYDFPLIEEAEKNSGEELPFEIVTALCTIAALRLKGEDEVDENDIFIKKKTISVILDDGRNTDESVEMAKRERTIKDELTSIMLGIGQQEETGATLDADVAAALQKAALDVAYAKKYFDAENNEFVYFPSVAKTICSYSLIEEAEKYVGSADREISPDLTKILCIAAASYLKGNTNEVDEDNEDIMKISVDVDVRRSTVTEFSLVAEDSVAFSDASEADREPQSRSKPAVGKQSELETRNNDAYEERQSKESLGSSATPVSAKLTLNNGSKVTPDLVEDESYSTDLRSESENDHRDTDGEVPESISPNEQINDPKITSQSVLTPTSGSILEESAKDMIDCSREDNEFIYTKEVEVDLDSNKTDHTQNHLVEDFDEEEARLKEMGQILEFKHRVDEQKISDDADALEVGKKTTDNKVLVETKKLEDDHRIDEARLEEEASLLLKKWLDDDREIDQALNDLEGKKISELKRIEDESSSFTTKQKLERDDLEKEREEIETQFLLDETEFSRNTKILEEKLATAVRILELVRNNTDTGMQIAETDPDVDKGRGFFGFGGGKNKNNDLEREKLRQSKLTEFKLRETELEKDMDGIKLELKKIKEKATEHECKTAEWQDELNDETRHLDEIASATEGRLQQEMGQLSSSFKEERRSLIKDKNDIKKTKRSDDKWLASAKKKLRDKYKLDQEKIEVATVERKKIELEEEERLKKIARALEEKWDKEKRAFSLELEAFERKKREHATTIDLPIGNDTNTTEDSNVSDEKMLNGEKSRIREVDGESLELEFDRKAEEERKRIEAEGEAVAKADEEKKRLEFVAKAKADKERKRLETVAKSKADEEKKRLEAVAKAEKERKAEKEQKRLDIIAKAKADEEMKRLEVVAKVKADKETKRLEAVAKAEEERIAEEEGKRLEAVSKAKAEEERKRLEAAEVEGESESEADTEDKNEEDDGSDKDPDITTTITNATVENSSDDDDTMFNDDSHDDEESSKNDNDNDEEPDDTNNNKDDNNGDDNSDSDEEPDDTNNTKDDNNGDDNSDSDEEPDDTNSIKDDNNGDDNSDSDGDGDGAQPGSSSSSVSSSSSADESTEEEGETENDQQNNKNDDTVQNKVKEEEEREQIEAEVIAKAEVEAEVEVKEKAYQEVKRVESKAKAEVKAKVEEDAVIKRMTEKETGRIEIKKKTMLTVEEDETSEVGTSEPVTPSFAYDNGIRAVPSHLAMLHQPKSVDLQNEMSLSSLDNIFDPPKAYAFPNKLLLSAALKGKEQETLATSSPPDESKTSTIISTSVVAQGVPSHLAMLHQPKSVDLQNEMSLSMLDNIFDPPKAYAFPNKLLLSAALKGKEQETLATSSPPNESKTNTITSTAVAQGGNDDTLPAYNSPSKTLTEKRRKVEQARERAMVIRRGGETGAVSQVSNVTNRTKPSLLSPSPQQQQHHSTDRIYHMIKETDRLSGFIRRYENKLETVCKSLLACASDGVVDDGEEKEALAAATTKELSLPEMFDFIIEQNWYKAHSQGTKSVGNPHLTFSKAESKGVESLDRNNDVLYTVTTTGKSFLQRDGPVQADVGRFLVYLDHAAKVGLTKDIMLVQWKEIARLSGDIQSKRVYDRLNELISFCLDFHMIEKK